MQKTSNCLPGFSAGFALSCALTWLLPQAAAALISDSEAVEVVEKAKILAPTIRINARVRPDEIEIATYKNPKANASDCKIEAVLIAKTLMDFAPGQVSRVTVYFYSSTSLSTYKEVAVTAGDVKAFGAGSVSKDELLKSLEIKEDAILDPSKRVASYLSEGQYVRPKKVNTQLRDNQIFISTVLDTTLSERLLKLEAMRLADQALEAAPVEYKSAQITFVDTSLNKDNRVITLSRSAIATVGEALNNSLQEVAVSVIKGSGADGKLDLQTYELKEGLRKEERAAILAEMQALDKAGVSAGKAAVLAFLDLEESANTATDVELLEKIDKLKALLAKLQDNLKTAQDFKPIGATKPGAPEPVKPAPVVVAPVYGDDLPAENLKARVLANPAAHVAAMEEKLSKSAPGHKGENHANFPIILKHVIDTLKENGRAAEAVPFEQRLAKLQTKEK